MSFVDEASALMQEQVFSAGWLVGDDQSIYWNTENWDVNPNEVIQQWKQNSGSLVLGGIKFTIIDNAPTRCISTNLQGQGHLFISRCPNYAAWMVAYSPSTNQKDVAFAQIARISGLVK